MSNAKLPDHEFLADAMDLIHKEIFPTGTQVYSTNHEGVVCVVSLAQDGPFPLLSI